MRPRGRPPGEATNELKSKLLQAAISHFGNEGFNGASLNQIAHSAGVDLGLIRYYFGTKDDLWQAAIEHIAAEFGRTMASIAKAPTHSEQLKSTIRAFLELSAQWPQLSRIIVFDGSSNDYRATFIAKHLIAPFYRMMAKLIAGAKAEGSVPDVANRTIFFMITHGGSFPMALPALTNKFPGGNINSPASLRKHADAVIELIFRKQ